MTTNGYKVSFWSNENVLELDRGDDCISTLKTTELYTYIGRICGM